MRQKKKKGNSTRALLGLEGFTNYGIQTAGGELAFFLVQLTNISVLSHANVEIKIRHLLMVLSAHPGLEISCLDSCERFDDNKRFIKRRMQEEENPAIRRVLEQEIGYLESKQIEMSTARQFLFVLRFTKGEKPEHVVVEPFLQVPVILHEFCGVIGVGGALLHIRVHRRLYAEQAVPLHKGVSVDGLPNQKLCHGPFVAVIAGAKPKIRGVPLEAQSKDRAHCILGVNGQVHPGVGGPAGRALLMLQAIRGDICPVHKHSFGGKLADIFPQGGG